VFRDDYRVLRRDGRELRGDYRCSEVIIGYLEVIMGV